MYKILHLFLFVALFSCTDDDSSNNSNTTTELTSGVNEITIQQVIDGASVSRSVYLRTPENMESSSSYPLVFFFHGAGGSNQDFLNNQFIVNLINQGEFIGVYPNGYSNTGGNGGFWNLGSEPTNADDVVFVDLIMQALEQIAVTDTNQSYAIGYSNGAGMTNLLGKQTSHFRAIAPLYSQQLTSIGTLSAVNELSIFQLSGEDDDIVPLAGGQSPVGDFMSAEQSAVNWATNFDCDLNSVQQNLSWGSITLNAHTFSLCSNSHEVTYMIAENIGHGWSDNQADEILYDYVWNFFKQH